MNAKEKLAQALLHPKQQWNSEDADVIQEEFVKTDNIVFKGLLQKAGVTIDFYGSVTSKNGTYYYNNKTITLNANNTLQRRIETLYHEMVHAYGGELSPMRTGHDQWFWFTYGQVCAIRGIAIGSFPRDYYSIREASQIK